MSISFYYDDEICNSLHSMDDDEEEEGEAAEKKT